MKRILVPLDGSSRAEHALAVAEKLARATGGTLILVRALTLPVEYDNPLVPQVLPLSIEEDQRCAQDYLTRQASLPMLSGLRVETDVRTESPALAILTAALEYGADLIVMTSHGRTGLSHWVFGSVAEHVIRQAHVPVLVLREHELPFWTGGAQLVIAPQEPQEPQEPQALQRKLQAFTLAPLRVLVPLDGSSLAEQALDPAVTCALALARGVEQELHTVEASSAPAACLLHLVMVIPPYETNAANMPEALALTGAEEYLTHLAERLHELYPGVVVTWEVLAGVDVADTLVTIAEGQRHTRRAEGQETVRTSAAEPVARQNRRAPAFPPEASEEFTLLAMATHGRTGVLRWVWGSITERVIHKTTLPVLLVRPQQLQRTAEQCPAAREWHENHDIRVGIAAPQHPIQPTQPKSVQEPISADDRMGD